MGGLQASGNLGANYPLGRVVCRNSAKEQARTHLQICGAKDLSSFSPTFDANPDLLKLVAHTYSSSLAPATVAIATAFRMTSTNFLRSSG